MSSQGIIIIGAGGHAKPVADALLSAGKSLLGFTDMDPARHGQLICGKLVLGDDGALNDYDKARVELANGIGGIGKQGDVTRRKAQEKLEAQGWRFVGVQHPGAIVSPLAVVEDGVHLLAGCIVQADARIGKGTIINTGAVIEHDARIGAWSHIAPLAVLCGNVTTGCNCHIGAGAVVIQDCRLTDNVVVGAGSVMTSHCLQAGVWVGVPARPIERKST